MKLKKFAPENTHQKKINPKNCTKKPEKRYMKTSTQKMHWKRKKIRKKRTRKKALKKFYPAKFSPENTAQ